MARLSVGGRDYGGVAQHFSPDVLKMTPQEHNLMLVFSVVELMPHQRLFALYFDWIVEVFFPQIE